MNPNLLLALSLSLFSLLLSPTHSQPTPAPLQGEPSPPPPYLWKPLLAIANSTFESAFLPPYLNLRRDVLPSPYLTATCRADLEGALVSLGRRETWAVGLFNAWAKLPPSGWLRGTLTDFGDYDQCLGLAADLPDHFTPQYCLLGLSLPLPPMPSSHNYYHPTPGLLPRSGDGAHLEHRHANGTFYRHLEAKSSVFYYATLQLGLCLPRSCSEEEILRISESNSKKLGLSVKSLHCEVRPSSSSPVQLTPVQLGALGFLLLVVCLTIAAAIYDRLLLNKKSSPIGSFLLWFSPGRNIRKLMLSQSTDSDLSCIHGLRFFSICWVVVGHTLEWNDMNIFRDTFLVRDRLSSLHLQPLFKAPFAVETFFYLSGLLTSYMTLAITAGQYGRFSSASFLFLRYLRLTPQFAVFLLLTTLLPPLFDGPIWYATMGKITHNCALTWWHSLLYLHNFIDFEHICGIHTWFLANDMQLHLLALPAVVLLLRNRRHGLLFISLCIGLTTLLCSLKIYLEQFPPDTVITSKTDFRDAEGNPSVFYYFYFKPWIHILPFFIGFIFGDYLMNHKIGRKNRILSKTSKYSLWLLVGLLFFLEVYHTVPYLRGRPYDRLWSAFVFPLTRYIWAAMLSLIIWLCSTGNSALLGRFLSWSAFRPLSRMTYSVYLTHAWTLWIALGTRRELIDISPRSIGLLAGGVLLCVYLVGFVFTVLFEAPLFHLLEWMKGEAETRLAKAKTLQTDFEAGSGGGKGEAGGAALCETRKRVDFALLRENSSKV